MDTTLITGKGYDRDLSLSQKKWIAFGIGAISFMFWLYSMPNTANVAYLIAKDVAVFNSNTLAIVMAVVLSFGFMVGEYVFLGIAIWKSNIFLLVAIAFGLLSVYATYHYQGLAGQSYDIKNQDLNISQNLVNQWQSNIKSLDDAIEARNKQLNSLDREEQKYDYGEMPSYIPARKRVAAEQIEKYNHLKVVYTDSLKRYSETGLQKRQKYGFMVSIGHNKTFSWGFALFVEAVILGCGYLAFLLYDSKKQDAKGSIGFNSRSMPNIGMVSANRSPVFNKPVQNIGSTPEGTPNEGTPEITGVHVHPRSEGTPEKIEVQSQGTPDVDGTPEKKGTPIGFEIKGTPNEGTPDFEKTVIRKGTPNPEWQDLKKENNLTEDKVVGIAKQKGISDPVIIYLKLDNQNWGYKKIGNKSAELLKRNKPISPTYIKRVLTREGLI